MSPSPDSPTIAGLGIACLDYLFVTEEATPGGYARLVDHSVEGGGLVATALVAAARLGAAAEIVTWVGDDEEGRLVLDGLRKDGVDVSRAEVVTGGRTAISFIQVEAGTGERTIYHRRGIENVTAQPSADLACDVALIDGVWPEASLAFARSARERKVPVVGDFCPTGRLEALASYTTALIVNRQCGEAMGASWQKRLGRLAALGPEFVAITAGEQGCYYLDGGEVRHQQPFNVEVADTTGAGDVFHGAFAYALARRWGYPTCTEFASAAAALSCRALGGRRGIPALEEVQRMVGGDKRQGKGEGNGRRGAFGNTTTEHQQQ
ncbi:MAG: PfkB family carbohydrate kinase [Armatimonadota bacterium]